MTKEEQDRRTTEFQERVIKMAQDAYHVMGNAISDYRAKTGITVESSVADAVASGVIANMFRRAMINDCICSEDETAGIDSLIEDIAEKENIMVEAIARAMEDEEVQ